MLSLATRLRALDDATLRRALEVRLVAPAGIRDFFDLADALLEPGAVQKTLAHLDRATLAVLAGTGELVRNGAAEAARLSAIDPAAATTGAVPAPTLTEVAAHLSELSGAVVPDEHVAARATELDSLLLCRVVDGRITPYDAVSAQLFVWPAQGLPSASDLVTVAAPAALAPTAGLDIAFTNQLAAERAFACVSSLAELVSELARDPARELSRGGLGLPDTKRLALVMSVEIENVAILVTIAARADLIAHSEGYWMETEVGEAWLLNTTPERWAVLAQAWLTTVPASVRDILPREPGVVWGAGLHGFIDWLYPAGGEWMAAQVAEFARDAEILGLTVQETTSLAGAQVLSGDLELARATMTESLPAEVGAVYLQHDLSIVAPGPLAPSIDGRLRCLADVEGRELASSYRITAASVNRALAAGENAETLLTFLGAISLTGIPQPVQYLIEESASRYGRVRVGSLPPGSAPIHSYVRSDDAALLGTIAVDQTLSALGLERDGDRLTTRFAADLVFWALSDARYPVAAENSENEIVHLRRHQVARVIPPTPVDPAQTLVDKLRASDGGEVMAADAWFARQLDTAIRSKATVTVSISMPGGAIVDYLLEPASVGGGRFRARDRRADIERTLPISSIISITPAP
ncbi:helicase-associated domain-containing protein [Cryobacterium psychrophilum]|uniref:Helicase XPB/Ssl2 N-terminal domain-containing protein n=1 Tax=Cryobacterium psychrophilum TaxID=41988 RepID=A0A4Y8KX02_9MICO|nr:helicase-associated domain-containing protein [Cryobacterium psychrophilum]TDW29474.1 XPB/Ssl2-like helicase family protein [Cryobacterium psychrophilum]TFD81392.1 hypothetical protein E3T53_02695 [Cryobacterium psychrophilum]